MPKKPLQWGSLPKWQFSEKGWNSIGFLFFNILGGRCLGAAPGATEVSCEKRPGQPDDWHSQFQLAPTDPPRGIAEILSYDGGISGKICLRKHN